MIGAPDESVRSEVVILRERTVQERRGSDRHEFKDGHLFILVETKKQPKDLVQNE